MNLKNVHFENACYKFAYPKSLVKEYNHWIWLIRPSQPTLGSSVLLSKDNVLNFSDLDQSSFSELKLIFHEMEKTLMKCFSYDKINHLMLMMQDPIVHFHTIPRYKISKRILNKEFKDFGFPSVPSLEKNIVLTDNEMEFLINKIKTNLVHG
jgi:diadenosine tetraphosphate (Ap4A) HIT family hydrolase